MKKIIITTLILFSQFIFAHEGDADEFSADEWGMFQDIEVFGCKKPTAAQLNEVNLGNTKASNFLSQCTSQTNNSPWCKQVMRPNPNSKSTFQCTYGASQIHQLINPNETTWPYAIRGVQLVQKLEDLGIKVCLIYNWWRPEPYNVNVGGAAGRHPTGTSIDVRFCTTADMEKAHKQLCKWRSQGHLRALGYYGTTALHLGVGDRTANTWGKNCSN